MPTMDPVKKYRLILIAISANICSFSVGTYVGWTSPVMPKLRHADENNPLSAGVTLTEEGWILSVAALGALCTAVIAGPTAGLIGRKRALLLSSTFLTAAYLSMLLAKSVWCILLGRFLQGAGGGVLITVWPMYAGEISTDDVRGRIGSFMSLFMAAGVVYAYSIGPFVSYWTLQWLCLAVPLLFMAIFVFMPETPYFYAIKNKPDEGIKALQFLRGQSHLTAQHEMKKIQASVDRSMSNKGTLVDIFRNNVYRKSLLICSGLLMFQQLSGATAIGFNSESIFTAANSALDPAIATIITGVVQMLSNFVTPFVVDRCGRQMILYIASIGMCVCLWILGTYFYLQKLEIAAGINWIPLPSMMVFYFLNGFGLSPIPYVVASEMFPSNIKNKAMTMASCVSCLTKFVMAKSFPEINALGPYYAFWLFGVFCMLGAFFVFSFTIETKGLSFEDIQDKLMYKGKKSKTDLEAIKNKVFFYKSRCVFFILLKT